MNRFEYIENLPDHIKKSIDFILLMTNIYPTGSRYICGKSNYLDCVTDYDFLLNLSFVDFSAFIQKIESMGYSLDNEYEDSGDKGDDAIISDGRYGFLSYRMKNVNPIFTINLILTANNDFYNNFVMATTICRDLNISPRSSRVNVFKGILYRDPHIASSVDLESIFSDSEIAENETRKEGDDSENGSYQKRWVLYANE